MTRCTAATKIPSVVAERPFGRPPRLLATRVWARRRDENSRSARARSVGRPRTRLLATRVWARRSSVDGRIATHGPCHLHDRPAHDHPAVQSISRRTQPASLRGALSSSRSRWDDGSHVATSSSSSYENSRSCSARARSFGRPRTRLPAPRVWARRSSVDRRIASDLQCHLHDRPAHDHPAVQFISRRTQPASLRGALSSSRDRWEDGSHVTASSSSPVAGLTLATEARQLRHRRVAGPDTTPDTTTGFGET